jgi:hypothetical protein
VQPFVPAAFAPPIALDHAAFRLRPLGSEHCPSDYAAWTSSIEHIQRTPGFEGGSWPHPMTLEQNREDLVRHADDFAARRAFAYTVLAPDEETVIGCVYIDPAEQPGFDATCRSWVRAADAPLDPVLHRVVADWLAAAWPFELVDHRGRSAAEVDRPLPGGDALQA